MVRQAAELQHANSKPVKKSNGHNGDWYDEIINHDMELDDHPNSNNYDRMDTEELSENQSEHLRILQETLVYGTELQAEFKDDPRREVKKGLDDIFALMAYQDPLNEKEVSHLLRSEGRMAVAEELNSAILRKFSHVKYMHRTCILTSHSLTRQVILCRSRKTVSTNVCLVGRSSRRRWFWLTREYRRVCTTKIRVLRTVSR